MLSHACVEGLGDISRFEDDFVQSRSFYVAPLVIIFDVDWHFQALAFGSRLDAAGAAYWSDRIAYAP